MKLALSGVLARTDYIFSSKSEGKMGKDVMRKAMRRGQMLMGWGGKDLGGEQKSEQQD